MFTFICAFANNANVLTNCKCSISIGSNFDGLEVPLPCLIKVLLYSRIRTIKMGFRMEFFTISYQFKIFGLPLHFRKALSLLVLKCGFGNFFLYLIEHGAFNWNVNIGVWLRCIHSNWIKSLERGRIGSMGREKMKLYWIWQLLESFESCIGGYKMKIFD